MKHLLALLICLFAVACNSCTPLPPPAPTPTPPVVVVDAGPSPLPMGGASPVDAGPEPAVEPGVRIACDALAKIPCAEGMNGCYRVLQKALTGGNNGQPITTLPLGCLTAARTKADARACGLVTCP